MSTQVEHSRMFRRGGALGYLEAHDRHLTAAQDPQFSFGFIGCGMMGQMPMMGSGMMGGQMPMMGGWGRMQILRRDLKADEVKHMMEHRLVWTGNQDIKLGKVTEKDGDTIEVEIVNKDDKVVQKFEVDRHTGWMQPAQ